MVAARHVALVAAKFEVVADHTGVDHREASHVRDDVVGDSRGAARDLAERVAVDGVRHVVDQRLAKGPRVDRAFRPVAVLAERAVFEQRIDRTDAEAIDLGLSVGLPGCEPSCLGGMHVRRGSGSATKALQRIAQCHRRHHGVAVGQVGDVGVRVQDVVS